MISMDQLRWVVCVEPPMQTWFQLPVTVLRLRSSTRKRSAHQAAGHSEPVSQEVWTASVIIYQEGALRIWRCDSRIPSLLAQFGWPTTCDLFSLPIGQIMYHRVAKFLRIFHVNWHLRSRENDAKYQLW
jgi:hypothetical protein